MCLTKMMFSFSFYHTHFSHRSCQIWNSTSDGGNTVLQSAHSLRCQTQNFATNFWRVWGQRLVLEAELLTPLQAFSAGLWERRAEFWGNVIQDEDQLDTSEVITVHSDGHGLCFRPWLPDDLVCVHVCLCVCVCVCVCVCMCVLCVRVLCVCVCVHVYV